MRVVQGPQPSSQTLSSSLSCGRAEVSLETCLVRPHGNSLSGWETDSQGAAAYLRETVWKRRLAQALELRF